MKNFDIQIADDCIQIKNMIKFLLLSIQSDKNTKLTDITNFLERVDILLADLCQKLKNKKLSKFIKYPNNI